MYTTISVGNDHYYDQASESVSRPSGPSGAAGAERGKNTNFAIFSFGNYKLT